MQSAERERIFVVSCRGIGVLKRAKGSVLTVVSADDRILCLVIHRNAHELVVSIKGEGESFATRKSVVQPMFKTHLSIDTRVTMKRKTRTYLLQKRRVKFHLEPTVVIVRQVSVVNPRRVVKNSSSHVFIKRVTKHRVVWVTIDGNSVVDGGVDENSIRFNILKES